MFLRTGSYYRSLGYIAVRDKNAYWWHGSVYSADTHGYNVSTGPGYVYNKDASWKGNGFGIRCVAR